MFCSRNSSIRVPSAESDVYTSEGFAWTFFMRQNIAMSCKRKQKRNTVYKLDSKLGTCLEISTQRSGILQFYFYYSLLKDSRSLSLLNFQNVSALLWSDFLLIFDFGTGKIVFKHELRQCSDMSLCLCSGSNSFTYRGTSRGIYVLLTPWK